jgi:recombination protein RecA
VDGTDSSIRGSTPTPPREKTTPRVGGVSIDSVVAAVNKRLGDGTLLKGHDLRHHVLPRVSSGSLALDIALGGGWPLNCWNEIQGEPSNGKSVLALKTIAANQAVDNSYTALWIAAEPFVTPWAIACGVDMDRMIVADTRVMEEAYQIAIEMLDDRHIDALVIDSLSALTPIEEDEKAMDDMQVALGARITGKFMRKSSVAQRRSLTQPDRNCLCLIISQWREKVGVMYGDNRITPYGRAKEFFYMIRGEVRRDEFIGPDKHRVGLALKVRITKNKTAPPQRMATLDFYWEDHERHRAGDFDVGKQVANIAMDLDVVELNGSMYAFGGQKWRGKEQFFTAIEEDAKLQRDLEQEVRRRAGLLGLTPTIDTDAVEATKPRKRIAKRG